MKANMSNISLNCIRSGLIEYAKTPEARVARDLVLAAGGIIGSGFAAGMEAKSIGGLLASRILSLGLATAAGIAAANAVEKTESPFARRAQAAADAAEETLQVADDAMAAASDIAEAAAAAFHAADKMAEGEVAEPANIEARDKAKEAWDAAELAVNAASNVLDAARSAARAARQVADKTSKPNPYVLIGGSSVAGAAGLSALINGAGWAMSAGSAYFSGLAFMYERAYLANTL